MSLTSYRAAPSRANRPFLVKDRKPHRKGETLVIVNGFTLFAHDTEPGGVLLFRRLGGSTIGAAWFHGRVRDGIGWGTGAMTTKLGIMCENGSIDAPC